ncbi:MAG TPA: putative DNA-binding domain-containing protein [Sandaracinaceae bacterium LLY-WYZ-13_1]|nr:putative DNA-binding domain-containing protein [Sandaracinaceae bacterium LLY-WYZ-13_1]
MTSLEDVQRAFTRVCFEREPPEDALAMLHAPRERWMLYRRMVRHRLFGMARSGLPKTAALLGDERFDAAVAAYLAERSPRTRFIREVVHELVTHALPGWEADPSLPAHLGDLVRYEDTKWRVASVDGEAPACGELDFERPAVINPTVRTLVVRHRVDKSAEDPKALDEPHLVLVYRAPGSAKIRTYVLNDVGGRLFRAWTKDQSCADGAREVMAALGREPDARFIDGMAGVLADLVEQKVVLGSPR